MKAQMCQSGPVSIEFEIKANSVGIKSEMRDRALLERASEMIQARIVEIVYVSHDFDLECL